MCLWKYIMYSYYHELAKFYITSRPFQYPGPNLLVPESSEPAQDSYQQVHLAVGEILVDAVGMLRASGILHTHFEKGVRSSKPAVRH
jgi:hypothetical protein